MTQDQPLALNTLIDMSKKHHRPLLAPEEELVEAVDLGIKRYLDESISDFIVGRRSRVKEVHLVPHWKDLFQKNAMEGGDQVRKAVKTWLFDGEHQGTEVLEVDTLCEFVRRRIGSCHLIPEKTRQAKLKKNLDAHGQSILKPWTDSLSLRTELRPKIEEITGRINAARTERYKNPSEFREAVFLTLGTFFLTEPYDLISHEDGEAVVRFLSELTEEIESLTSEENPKKTSLDNLLVAISVWMHRGGGRTLLESLSFTIDEVGQAFSRFIDSDLERKDSLYELKKIIVDSLAPGEVSTLLPDQEDLNVVAESEFHEITSDEECDPPMEVSDTVLVDSLSDPIDDNLVSEAPSMAQVAPLQYIKDLRSLRHPVDTKRAQVLEHILSTNFASVSFTRGFFRATISQIDLVLKHPSNYSVSQVRVLTEIMERLFDSYKISSNDKLNVKVSSTEFTESLVMGILSKAQELGPRHAGMKQAQIQVDLLNEEVRTIQVLTELIVSSQADPRSQMSISRALLEGLKLEQSQVPDTSELEQRISHLDLKLPDQEAHLISEREALVVSEESLKLMKGSAEEALKNNDWTLVGALAPKIQELLETVESKKITLEALEKLYKEYSDRYEELVQALEGSSGKAESLKEQIDAAELQILESGERIERLEVIKSRLAQRENELIGTMQKVELQMALVNEQLAAVLEGRLDLGQLESEITQR